MTQADINAITLLQRKGFGYKKIAAETGLSVNTVKSYCYRHPIKSNIIICESCGKELKPHPLNRPKRFCSDECRVKWWQAHPNEKKHNVLYPHICEYCHKAFETPKRSSRYCSRKCYADARRKAVEQ